MVLGIQAPPQRIGTATAELDRKQQKPPPGYKQPMWRKVIIPAIELCKALYQGFHSLLPKLFECCPRREAHFQQLLQYRQQIPAFSCLELQPWRFFVIARIMVAVRKVKGRSQPSLFAHIQMRSSSLPQAFFGFDIVPPRSRNKPQRIFPEKY